MLVASAISNTSGSCCRAKSAKNRKLSIERCASTRRASASGLPVSLDSRCAISSLRCSRPSAILSSQSARSSMVRDAQSLRARIAACAATSTSAFFERAIVPISCPVAGLTFASVSPSTASTKTPSMKFNAFMRPAPHRTSNGLDRDPIHPMLEWSRERQGIVLERFRER